jgi:ribosome-associated translation inhibitor RaiA
MIEVKGWRFTKNVLTKCRAVSIADNGFIVFFNDEVTDYVYAHNPIDSYLRKYKYVMTSKGVFNIEIESLDTLLTLKTEKRIKDDIKRFIRFFDKKGRYSLNTWITKDIYIIEKITKDEIEIGLNTNLQEHIEEWTRHKETYKTKDEAIYNIHRLYANFLDKVIAKERYEQ